MIMTEKRFELTMNGNEVAQYEIIDHNQENLTVYNNLGNVYFSSAMKVCELLNSFEDENEQLKHEINYLENRLDDYICLKKENKDLKEENLELSQKILKGLFEDENDELRKENKKLKKELEWCRMTVDGLKGN